MATQLLVNVLTVTNLAGGASTTLAHGLRSGDAPVTPTQVICDRASPLVVTASNSTSITVNNPTASPLTANFRCEFDHSIHAVGASPVKWSGLPVVVGAPPAVYGQFYSNIDQPIADGGVGISVLYFESTSPGANGVSAVDPGTGFASQLTVAAAGVYAFTLSPQLFKAAGAGAGQVTFWARKNGSDIAESCSFVNITNNQYVLPFIELMYPMAAGDYIEWVAHANTINVTVEQEPESFAPAIVRPAAPSIIAGVKLIGT